MYELRLLPAELKFAEENLHAKVYKVEQERNYRYRHCARVVKGLDSKSNGVTRAGSNPADVVLFLFLVNIVISSHEHLLHTHKHSTI